MLPRGRPVLGDEPFSSTNQKALLASTRTIFTCDIAPCGGGRAGLAALKSLADAHSHYVQPWVHTALAAHTYRRIRWNLQRQQCLCQMLPGRINVEHIT
eukprot:1453318-Pyramimonas_sp.AAC.1